MPADADAREPVAAHRVVDPRDADGEERGGLVRGEQWLAERGRWRWAWVEFEVTKHVELRSHEVGTDLSVRRRRRLPAEQRDVSLALIAVSAAAAAAGGGGRSVAVK